MEWEREPGLICHQFRAITGGSLGKGVRITDHKDSGYRGLGSGKRDGGPDVPVERCQAVVRVVGGVQCSGREALDKCVRLQVSRLVEVIAAVGLVLLVQVVEERIARYRVVDWYSSRSEEHTSELQSHLNLVCRLLLEKKKKKIKEISHNTSHVTLLTRSCFQHIL